MFHLGAFHMEGSAPRKTMATCIAPVRAHNPLISQRRSFWQRIFLTIELRFVKFSVTGAFKIISLLGIRIKAELPTYVKVYPHRPTLKNRIFVPKSYKTGDFLPLYIDIQYVKDKQLVLLSRSRLGRWRSPWPFLGRTFRIIIC